MEDTSIVEDHDHERSLPLSPPPPPPPAEVPDPELEEVEKVEIKTEPLGKLGERENTAEDSGEAGRNSDDALSHMITAEVHKTLNPAP